MAKRKTTAKKAPAAQHSESETPIDGSVDLRVRVDADIHRKVKEVAEECGLSISQLVAGVIEGVVDRMQPGFPKLQDKVVKVEPRSKCLFIGQPAKYVTYTEDCYNEEYARWKRGEGTEPNPHDIGAKTPYENGEVWFILDYSGRPVRYTVEKY